MVTHEFTVFADGHVDGEATARNGDRKSHTLHFVLAQGLTASAAKLLLWPAGAITPTQYDKTMEDAGEVSFTPITWQGAGVTTAQLELVNDAGDVSWQSCRFAIPVEAGIPDETLPPLTDASDATAEVGDVRRGKTFYAGGHKKTGAAVTQVASVPRRLEMLPIIGIEAYVGDYSFAFQRVADDAFWLVLPAGTALTDVELFITTPPESGFDLYRGGSLLATILESDYYTLEGQDFSEPQKWTIKWGDEREKQATITLTMMRAGSAHSCLEVKDYGDGYAAETYTSNVCRNGAAWMCAKLEAAPTTVTLHGSCFVEQNGVVTQKAVSSFTPDTSQGFSQLTLISVDGVYRKKLLLSWRPPEDAVISGKSHVRIWVGAAAAMLDGNTDFYDYGAAGFTLDGDLIGNGYGVDSSIAYIANLFGARNTRHRLCDGRVPLGLADNLLATSDDLESGLTISDLVTYACAPTVAASIDDTSMDMEVAGLKAGSITAEGRWALFLNGQPVDMPGAVSYLFAPEEGVQVDLMFTCADGFDIGYPYLGA